MEEWEPVERDHVVKFFQIINQQSHQTMVRCTEYSVGEFPASLRGIAPKFGAITRTSDSPFHATERASTYLLGSMNHKPAKVCPPLTSQPTLDISAGLV